MRKIKKYIIFSLLFISELSLFIIHFYYGISSSLDMLFDKFGIKLYFTLFWDYSKSTYKYWDYMEKAIKYHTNPKYCIIIFIAIVTLSVLSIIYQKKENSINKKLIWIHIIMLILSLFITLGVMYCYFDELSHEVV